MSTDRRKKEWILFEKGKVLEIGKVIRKEHKYIIIEHWQIESNNNTSITLARKCERCVLGKRNGSSCLMRLRYDLWHQVLEKVINKENTLIIDLPLSVYTKPRELIHSIDEVTPVQIEINAPSLERAVIQRVIRDEELQNELSSIAERLRDRKELDFYTDGSLVVECEEEKEAKRMGRVGCS